jgi:hypothetical protein
MKHKTLITRNLKYKMMFMYKNDKDNKDVVKPAVYILKFKLSDSDSLIITKSRKRCNTDYCLPNKTSQVIDWYCMFGCNLNYFVLFCFVSGLKMLKGWQIVAIIFVLSIWHCSANTRTKVSLS